MTSTTLPLTDARSEKNIATLLPKAQELARTWLAQVRQAGIPAVIICGTRTYAEQNELYAQGRTKPGKIVTKAKAGYSNHNFGIAWDFVIFEGVNENGSTGKALWDSPLTDKAAHIAEFLGLEWGGRWKFVDKPHLQLRTGLTLAQLRERVANGMEIV